MRIAPTMRLVLLCSQIGDSQTATIGVDRGMDVRTYVEASGAGANVWDGDGAGSGRRGEVGKVVNIGGGLHPETPEGR